MLTNNLGYPRIGKQRELKFACEKFWTKKITTDQFIEVGKTIRLQNWLLQKEKGIDLIPSNDFSFYDQVLDTSMMVGNVPPRFAPLLSSSFESYFEVYFAMARGYQHNNLNISPLEMTKWFDTNYHYLVPEFSKGQTFRLLSTKPIDEFIEAKEHGIITKPVLLGPVSYLYLGKEKENHFDRFSLIQPLVQIYIEVIQTLSELGANWIQIDEPILALDLNESHKNAFLEAYQMICQSKLNCKIMLATYFGGVEHHAELIGKLPIDCLHIDLVRAPEQLETLLNKLKNIEYFSFGIVDGRNIWCNDFEHSLSIINKAISIKPQENLMIAPSCSLMHVPYDVELEKNNTHIAEEVKSWLAFAQQKIEEIVTLAKLKNGNATDDADAFQMLVKNIRIQKARRISSYSVVEQVRERMKEISKISTERQMAYKERKKIQQQHFNLPLFPTTTIGSFPQTSEIRQLRARFKKQQITLVEYKRAIRSEIQKSIEWQEEVGLDVLVHGEFERNDMVEYFGEQLKGFAITQHGWVQSYGSRCVKPPIIFGDVYRPEPMTVEWITFAQSLTNRPVKGMLTGPVTMLQWSFVRDDQPRYETLFQIALAIRDEVSDLENSGIKIIQVDEPALREGLPLRQKDWDNYLQQAIKAFKIAVAHVNNDTQIHTHMCYSEFNDIIEFIASLDADVITIETSRSQMELLQAFSNFKYPNDIGPGVYDIHSPRIPSVNEITELLMKATQVINYHQIWVNPDCGLKTRGWDETKLAIANMVKAAKLLREKFYKSAPDFAISKLT